MHGAGGLSKRSCSDASGVQQPTHQSLASKRLPRRLLAKCSFGSPATGTRNPEAASAALSALDCRAARAARNDGAPTDRVRADGRWYDTRPSGCWSVATLHPSQRCQPPSAPTSVVANRACARRSGAPGTALAFPGSPRRRAPRNDRIGQSGRRLVQQASRRSRAIKSHGRQHQCGQPLAY